MKDKILQIAKEILGNEITLSTSMNNCPDWSSLRTVQLVMALDEVGMKIPIEKVVNIKSIEDIISLAYEE